MSKIPSTIRDFARQPVMAIWLTLMFALAAQAAEPKIAPPYAAPDDRYKTDILLIVAHPDDETGHVAGYLARAIFDEHRRTAVIYTTRGDAGGNAVGNEQGNALGAEREMEARQGLALLGVANVWFLNARDTPSTNVLRALEYMDHGSILAQVVRLIRLTRPEVVITWLPLPVAGENHADHQASSVVANEAFDLAGDPSVFAEQLGTAHREGGGGHDPEGLRPWQPKKIYFFSDATDVPGFFWPHQVQPSPFRNNFLDGAGPAYANTGASPAKQVAYARLIAEEQSVYLTQEGALGKEALEHGDFKGFEYPTRFIFGKSLVGGSSTGDIFERVFAGPIPFVRPSMAALQTHRGVSLEPGGPWAFYREFWAAHALERMGNLLQIPELSIRPGRSVGIPLVIRNDTGAGQNVTVVPVLPVGWTEHAPDSTFPLPANSAYPVHRMLTVPATDRSGWYEVTWKAEVGGRQSGSVMWRVYVIGRDS